MTLDVIRQDIADAANASLRGPTHERCPLARAARRMHPQADRVSVSHGHLLVTYPKHRISYQLPLKVSSIVYRYDVHGQMEPFKAKVAGRIIPKGPQEE